MPMMIPVLDDIANQCCIKCGIITGPSDDWDNLTEGDFICMMCHMEKFKPLP